MLGDSAVAVGLVELLWPDGLGRRTRLVALAAGAVALVVSGAAEGGIGLAAIAICALALVKRRAALARRAVSLVAALTVVCALGLLALRGGDIAGFGRYLGILGTSHSSSQTVNTYAQRTLMYYIALRVFEAHPLLGTGWQSMREAQVYSPFLPAAHREFPGQPAQAFPSPAHTWAVDDAYIQSLAELGLLGTALFLAMLGAGLWLGIAGSLRAPPERARVTLLGLLWLLVAMSVWLGQGLYAGDSFEALAFFGIGLALAAREPSGFAPAPAGA